MKKLVFFLFISTFSLAQKDGFWDKERAFTKEIKLASGHKGNAHELVHDEADGDQGAE